MTDEPKYVDADAETASKSDDTIEVETKDAEKETNKETHMEKIMSRNEDEPIKNEQESIDAEKESRRFSSTAKKEEKEEHPSAQEIVNKSKSNISVAVTAEKDLQASSNGVETKVSSENLVKPFNESDTSTSKTKSSSSEEVVSEPIIKKSNRKDSIVLEAKVTSDEATEVEWQKEVKSLESQEKKYKTSRKMSQDKKETIVQLEIEKAQAEDVGDYSVVATNEKGEKTSKKISISESDISIAKNKVEDVPMDAEGETMAAEVTEVKKKKKKKTVKKKKKKEEEEPTVAPEVVSFLKNLVRFTLVCRFVKDVFIFTMIYFRLSKKASILNYSVD